MNIIDIMIIVGAVSPFIIALLMVLIASMRTEVTELRLQFAVCYDIIGEHWSDFHEDDRAKIDARMKKAGI
jgi:hypothetical protein